MCHTSLISTPADHWCLSVTYMHHYEPETVEHCWTQNCWFGCAAVICCSVQLANRRLHGFLGLSRHIVGQKGAALLIIGWFFQPQIEESIRFAWLPRDSSDQPVNNKRVIFKQNNNNGVFLSINKKYDKTGTDENI